MKAQTIERLEEAREERSRAEAEDFLIKGKAYHEAKAELAFAVAYLIRTKKVKITGDGAPVLHERFAAFEKAKEEYFNS